MLYPPLSKRQVATIRQLALKKYRLKQATFVVEGTKSIQALLASHYTIHYIVGTYSFFIKNQHMLTGLHNAIALFEIPKEKLSQLGSYRDNHEVLAVVAIPPPSEPLLSGITFALDDIRDPGNLGTIIRIADWYGIKTILCSKTTVELYNPKVIQASMGSFTRVKLHYVDLLYYLQAVQLPIVGALLKGNPIHNFSFPDNGILVIGNESHGLHTTIQKILTHSIAIPKYGYAESLNAAIATAVACDNWRRNLEKNRNQSSSF